MNKKYLSLLVATATVASAILLATSASAATAPQGRMGGRPGNMPPGVFGTVSAVSGNSITVNSKGFGQNATATTYTVDASSATVTKNGATSSVSTIAVGDSVMVQGTVSGTSVTAKTIRDGVMNGPGNRMGMGVTGTVASVNGTTLTVTSKGRPAMNGQAATTPITYTVDASGATVTKNGTASSVSAIVMGDTVMVQGTVTGTSVVAKTIRDGAMQPQIQGNGQPIVAGKITAINGTSITITNASNVTYTIDASGAKFMVKGATNPTISNVAVGDNIVVQGAVNGNAVTAYSVTDQKAPANSSQGAMGGMMGGIFGGITNFFKHLFGF